MAEQRLLSTKTQATVNGASISIFTYYFADELPNTLDMFLADIASDLNGVGYAEGDLVFVLKNHPSQINFFLNEDGTISIDAADAAQYSINSMGELEYNKL